jgi:hypothetical protein
MNLIYKSLGMPPIEQDQVATALGPPSIDERNEELYDRDDHRQFHVPVFQVRNSFYSVMAKCAADAESIIRERMNRDGKDGESFGACQVGPAIEA